MAGYSSLRVAAAQYPLERMRDLDDFRDKLQRWVAAAATEKAELLLFPEYSGLELVTIFDRRTNDERRSGNRHEMGPLPLPKPDRRQACSIQREAELFQEILPDYLKAHASLARRYGVHIVAGSMPRRIADGSYRNTAWLFTPEGQVGSQDKIVMTRWEREAWGILGGDEIRVFGTPFGLIGINICYDTEFPLIARSQAEQGARIVLAPCCTDSLRGYHRVRVGARARALENQLYVIQSPTIGVIEGLGSIAANVGSAGVYAPPDLGPNADGVVAQGPFDASQWLYADLDLDALDRIRQNGKPANDVDWTHQLRAGNAVSGQYEAVA